MEWWRTWPGASIAASLSLAPHERCAGSGTGLCNSWASLPEEPIETAYWLLRLTQVRRSWICLKVRCHDGDGSDRILEGARACCVSDNTRVCGGGWFLVGDRRLHVLAPLLVEKQALFSSPWIWPREPRGRPLWACPRGTFTRRFCLSSRWPPLLGSGPRVHWPTLVRGERGPCCSFASTVMPGREPSEPRLVPAAQSPGQMNGCCLKPPGLGSVSLGHR